MMIGYPSYTTNVNISYGIWSWGAVELSFPNSYGYSYSLANGYQNNNTSGVSNLQIGTIQNFVDTMYISWQYTLAGQTYYGIDVVDNFSTPATTFNWQSLIYDGTVIYKTKIATRMKVKFKSFPAGYTLTPYYILDNGSPVYSSVSAKAGDTDIILDVQTQGRFKELQWGFVGTSSGATVPLTITGVTMEVEPISDEVDLRKDGS
jgi:hypothetical protein